MVQALSGKSPFIKTNLFCNLTLFALSTVVPRLIYEAGYVGCVCVCVWVAITPCKTLKLLALFGFPGLRDLEHINPTGERRCATRQRNQLFVQGQTVCSVVFGEAQSKAGIGLGRTVLLSLQTGKGTGAGEIESSLKGQERPEGKIESGVLTLDLIGLRCNQCGRRK